MADNFDTNPGTGGRTFAADDISGVLWTRVKSGWGADGAAQDTSVAAPFPVQWIPLANGGTLTHRLLSAATTNATSVKASAGVVYGIYAFNANAAKRYLKLYNKASAPTVGTDTPTHTFPIAPSDAGFILVVPTEFTTGIALATTTGVADNDTGAVAANEVLVHTFYK